VTYSWLSVRKTKPALPGKTTVTSLTVVIPDSIGFHYTISHFNFIFLLGDIHVGYRQILRQFLIYYPRLLLDFIIWGYSDPVLITRPLIKIIFIVRVVSTWSSLLSDIGLYFLFVILALQSRYVTSVTAASHTRLAKCNIVSNISVDDFWRISLLHFYFKMLYTLLSGLI